MAENNNGNPLVLDEIRRRIKKEGAISFREFMDIALYWPDGGYYMRKGDVWGKDGDYITGTDISPLYSRLMLRQIYEMWHILGSPEVFQLVEVGAGRGTLALEILKWAKVLHPDLYDTLQITVIEKNPCGFEFTDDRVAIYRRIEDLPGTIVGCILSNELLDSLPFHKVSQEGKLREVYVTLEGEELMEILYEPSTLDILRYLERIEIGLVEGQNAEVNLAALDWIKKAGKKIDRGFVFTIDYGYPARDYFSKMDGHLACHYRHTVNYEPFMRVGCQDITSHVDFTGIALYGTDASLEVTGFTTQMHFLLGVRILDELEEVRSFDQSGIRSLLVNQGIKRLIMPGGMGDTFKVLIQHKGIDSPVLSGFSFKDLKEVL